jgi:hypothetical protein
MVKAMKEGGGVTFTFDSMGEGDAQGAVVQTTLERRVIEDECNEDEEEDEGE